MNFNATAASLSLFVAACGGRTEGLESLGPHGSGGDGISGSGNETSTGGEVASAGRASTGGRETVGTGGHTATGGRGIGGHGTGGRGTGGLGAGGIVFGSGGLLHGTGGSVFETGGRPQRTPEAEKLVAYVCSNLCTIPVDCPSADPYAGGCNAITGTCLITCENGCPPDTIAVSVGGGCYCTDPRVSGPLANKGICCSSFCGPPYYLSCCGDLVCMPDGRCCSGPTCL